MKKLKNLLLVVCLFNLITSIGVANPENAIIQLTLSPMESAEDRIEFATEYLKIINFAEEYESQTARAIKDVQEYVHIDKSFKASIGISVTADGILIGVASGKGEHLHEAYIFYGRASVIKEYVPKIKKTSTDSIAFINLTYDGSDELEEIYYGNRSYLKIQEDLDELVKKGVLKKKGDNEYENEYGVEIVIIEIPNFYPPVMGLYTHLYPEYVDNVINYITLLTTPEE